VVAGAWKITDRLNRGASMAMVLMLAVVLLLAALALAMTGGSSR
jgi:FlaG/FlaF family flagellin (archaellin)